MIKKYSSLCPAWTRFVVVLNSVCRGTLSNISLKLSVILVASFVVYMYVIHLKDPGT